MTEIQDSPVVRTYLFVPPQEKAEVQLLGAHWDGATKRWYLNVDQSSARFSRWLPFDSEVETADDTPFTMDSDEAFVAATTTSCQHCNSRIEVICIHCKSGTASGEPLTHFTVSHIWAMDDTLKHQLQSWPNFRKANKPTNEFFANHCPHCDALQEDLYLHTEPGDPFFDIPDALPGSISFTPL